MTWPCWPWRCSTTFPSIITYFSAHGMTYLGGNLPSINAILYLYPGADGLKTGFTCGSGYNLVASALRDGKRVIGVLLGGLTSDQRFGGMRMLLDKGFAAEGARAASPLTIDQMKDADAAPPPAAALRRGLRPRLVAGAGRRGRRAACRAGASPSAASPRRRPPTTCSSAA